MSGKNHSVILILKNLSEGVRSHDLASLFYDLPIRQAKKLKISACNVIRLKSNDDRDTELLGMVTIQPATAAYQAQLALNGKFLYGRPLVVSRYRERSTFRERRKHSATLESVNPDRRQWERRREGWKLEMVEDRKFGFLPEFQRRLKSWSPG